MPSETKRQTTGVYFPVPYSELYKIVAQGKNKKILRFVENDQLKNPEFRIVLPAVTICVDATPDAINGLVDHFNTSNPDLADLILNKCYAKKDQPDAKRLRWVLFVYEQHQPHDRDLFTTLGESLDKINIKV